MAYDVTLSYVAGDVVCTSHPCVMEWLNHVICSLLYGPLALFPLYLNFLHIFLNVVSFTNGTHLKHDVTTGLFF